jgi:hypothetical protein
MHEFHCVNRIRFISTLFFNSFSELCGLVFVYKYLLLESDLRVEFRRILHVLLTLLNFVNRKWYFMFLAIVKLFPNAIAFFLYLPIYCL